MQTTLLTAGIACVIAAIVGGGLKAFEIEMPVLNSRVRQVILASFGLLLIGISVWPSNRRSNGETPSAPVTKSECLRRYIQDVPTDRSHKVEAGALDVQLIGPQQSKEHAVAVLFTENGHPLGAMKFHFYAHNSLFKIASIIDARCAAVTELVNAGRGGDPLILQNWDELHVRFAQGKYSARLGYSAGEIDLDFRRISPAR